jgi:putative FmdB family regulatory protein
MPIYSYRCESCGHAKDILLKVSDPVLTTCPACGAESFRKQLTAAGFQLKGSGWYVTDFKGDAKPPKAPADPAKPEPAGAEAGAPADGAKASTPETPAATPKSDKAAGDKPASDKPAAPTGTSGAGTASSGK